MFVKVSLVSGIVQSDAGSLLANLAVVEQVFDEVGLTFELLHGQC